jgi:hypothetical protein
VFLCVLALFLPSLRAQGIGSVKVTVPRANVRSEPKDTAPVLTQVTSGTVLTLIEIDGDWFHVQLPPDPRLGGVRVDAYISKKVSTVVSMAAPGATPAPSTTAPAGGATGSPNVTDGMSVSLQSGASTSWLAVRRTSRITAAASGKIAALASLASLEDAGATAGSGASIVTYVWRVDGPAADREIADRRPSFVVQFKDVPDASPDTIGPLLIRLAPGAASRVVSAIRGRADQVSQGDSAWDVTKDLVQDVVKTNAEPLDRGVVKLTPVADLAPGQYAIVLRPAGKRKLAGSDVLASTGEGRVFGLVWDFSIAAK